MPKHLTKHRAFLADGNNFRSLVRRPYSRPCLPYEAHGSSCLNVTMLVDLVRSPICNRCVCFRFFPSRRFALYMRKNGAALVQSRRTEGSDTRQVRCLTVC